MGDEPPHGTVPGGVSVQGGQMNYRKAVLVVSGQKLVVPPIRGDDVGVRV